MQVTDPSLLRFLVDLRGEDVTGKQLRDDLMTMLIAGHETTAAVLTWSVFCLTQNPSIMATLQAEVDTVLGDRAPTLADLKAMPFLRNVRFHSSQCFCFLPIYQVSHPEKLFIDIIKMYLYRIKVSQTLSYLIFKTKSLHSTHADVKFEYILFGLL